MCFLVTAAANTIKMLGHFLVLRIILILLKNRTRLVIGQIQGICCNGLCFEFGARRARRKPKQ
jgi:hypothetical protein